MMRNGSEVSPSPTAFCRSADRCQSPSSRVCLLNSCIVPIKSRLPTASPPSSKALKAKSFRKFPGSVRCTPVQKAVLLKKFHDFSWGEGDCGASENQSTLSQKGSGPERAQGKEEEKEEEEEEEGEKAASQKGMIASSRGQFVVFDDALQQQSATTSAGVANDAKKASQHGKGMGTSFCKRCSHGAQSLDCSTTCPDELR